MAPPLTLKQEKFLSLMNRFGAHAVPLACPGLMELVEKEDQAGARKYLEALFSSWNPDQIDAVVLGCTHYVFLRDLLRTLLDDHTAIIDGNEGTARQTRRVMENLHILRSEGPGEVELHTSGDPDTILPVMRRLLERMGSGFSASRGEIGTEIDSAIAHTVLACTEMSASRTGALVIFERSVKLNEIMSTGTIINADTNAELIKNIFFNKAPLHDGALIIRDGRIAAAGCVLPLTKSTNLSKELGMRHRAGIGLSEQSDAVVVIVSEETGSISVAIDGMLKRHLTSATLERLLRSELIVEDSDRDQRGFKQVLKKLFKGKNNEKDEHNEKTV
jgi:DNA integrity scanning protein DisA with diadenylate cyclase activity